jgi:putative peptidoglycan binding protein
MKKIILSLIWVAVAAVPASNAQQASPSQTTMTQQTPKPKPTGKRPLPQPRFQPTQATTANNNPGREKGVANNPSHRKPAVNNAGNGKPAVNSPGNGNTIVTNGGHGKNTKDNRDSYADAMGRYRHERHDCDWWKQRYVVIVLVGGGYYYRDAGYWYPAWGYDPNYERYDYDGPIYTYGNLLPDQVIINVQRVLQQLGYYTGDLNGSLGVDTRQALSAYQQDYGLDATGVIDEATVRALGLI